VISTGAPPVTADPVLSGAPELELFAPLDLRGTSRFGLLGWNLLGYDIATHVPDPILGIK
jgi:hypothetical protein